MNNAHLHLLFNHLPIIIPIVGIMVLIAGMYLDSPMIKRTAYGIFILGAVTTLPAFFTGEGAEEVVENLVSGGEQFIENHEEDGKIFSILSYLLGALSLAGIWTSLQKKSFANQISWAILIFSFGVLYFAQKTGNSGGQIMHTEIRKEPSANQFAPQKGEGEKEEDE
jgi:uncharacterized membrane protein